MGGGGGRGGKARARQKRPSATSQSAAKNRYNPLRPLQAREPPQECGRSAGLSRVGESGDCCVLAACAAAAACLCVATALEHNSQMGCRTPIASFPAADKVAFSCGSSWEVDLRSDADCNQPGLERCHPRYTLGWQHRERCSFIVMALHCHQVPNWCTRTAMCGSVADMSRC